MKASQTVFLNHDRTKAVAEGDKDAKFLLVREGHEISDSELERHADTGAPALVKAGKKSDADHAKAKEKAADEQGKKLKAAAKK